MHLLYNQSKGRRLKKQFMWIQVLKLVQKDPLYDESLWWDYEQQIWTENPIGSSSNCKDCHSIKAFKRHIRKHPEIKDHKAILVSEFKGCDVEYIVT